ncbi:MAG: stage II sporulation protein P [Halanaerobiales bacterium]
MTINNYLRLVLIISLLFLFTGNLLGEDYYREEEVVEVYDRKGEYIFSIALGVSPGDRYISEDNIEYVIKKVQGNRAEAEKLGEVDLLIGIADELGALSPLAAEGKKIVAIYHTHNAESYPPGPISSQGRGDIHDVGKALAGALQKQGVRAIHSENMHLPQDGAAYSRSRATALNLVRQQPDCILDLHRDAIPDKKTYSNVIAGKPVTKIRLVVGRQNPNRAVIDKFARQLKAVSDKNYPGLIKDIFYGSGDYNQSVYPRSLLLEVGTFRNTAQEAKNGVTLLASPLASVLYGGKGDNPLGSGRESRSALKTFFWLIAFIIIGGTGYLYVKEGSWEGVKKRLRNYISREILDRGGGK